MLRTGSGQPVTRVWPLAVLWLFASVPAWAQGVPKQRPAASLPRAEGPVKVDGVLDEPAWGQAALIDTFYETAFGDNRRPVVRTAARLMYDTSSLYVGVECEDPFPHRIRAPFVDRDNVFGDQDNFVVLLDTRNERRTALEFRVNPRGIQGDGVYNDASGNEDFSPDFYFETASRITERGWAAEIRIPLTSLRYSDADPQTWSLLLFRNYPREFRYVMFSSPVPRNTNCVICLSGELSDIRGLPQSRHLVVAPYVSGQRVDEAPASGAPLERGPIDGDLGLDAKWSPSSATVLDATVNPDFSQIEADVPRIAVNNRFALFYPEKRPFFLEGFDLLETPITAVYTRTITSPRWGGRATGKLGDSSYTLFAAQDRGGGSVVLPGPTGSTLADQDFRSVVGVGRYRRELGTSYAGFVYTGREIEGGGGNHVFGPDFQWRAGRIDSLTAQFLWSETETPQRPDLAAEWDGRRLSGHALYASYAHSPERWEVIARYSDFADGFRADQGFVPQVGYRRGYTEGSALFYPSEGLLTRVRATALAEYQEDRAGDLLLRRVGPVVAVQGRRALDASVGLSFDRVRTGDVLLDRTQVPFHLQLDPSRWLTRVSVTGTLGEEIDLVEARVGRGGNVNANLVLRPTSHLNLDLVSAWSWLDVDDPAGGRARLFTASVQRAKLVYNFTARLYLRLIAEWVDENRNPSLYAMAVTEDARFFTGSALLAYRLNWQTAVFAGYGDQRERPPQGGLVPASRQFFVKLSYALQR
jgi:hypothetical protein